MRSHEKIVDVGPQLTPSIIGCGARFALGLPRSNILDSGGCDALIGIRTVLVATTSYSFIFKARTENPNLSGNLATESLIALHSRTISLPKPERETSRITCFDYFDILDIFCREPASLNLVKDGYGFKHSYYRVQQR